MVRRVMRGSIFSELLMCVGGLHFFLSWISSLSISSSAISASTLSNYVSGNARETHQNKTCYNVRLPDVMFAVIFFIFLHQMKS